MEQEEKINWEKLLRYMEGAERDGEELNQEELEMLLLSDEINMRLQEKDPKLRFPVEQGWQELKQRHEQKAVKVKKIKLYRLIAVAAVLAVVLIPVWLFFSPNGQGVNGPVNNQISLTLANGETVEVNPSKSGLLQAAGATLNGTSLVYKKETDLPKVGQELSTNVLTVPHGKYTQLTLSDGTVVWINAGSKLTYTVPFAADKREVSLEGEAYFDVSHQASRPFIVHVKAMDVKVLGTAFSINTLSNTIFTALERGRVSLNAAGEAMELEPGELGRYEESRGLSKVQTDLKLYTAWKDQDIYFDNNTLEEIAARLGREYNVKFVFEQQSLKNLHFTVDMSKQAGLEKILNNLKVSSGQVNFVMKEDVITVKVK